MRNLRIAALIMCAACTAQSTPTSNAQPPAFCEPVVSAYEEITDEQTIRQFVATVSANAGELKEIPRATIVALAAELQIGVTAGTWSTNRLASTINDLCGTELETHASP